MAQSTQYRRETSSSDLKDKASELKDKATDQFERMADRATDQFGRMADQVEGVASRVADQGRQVGEQVSQVADRFKGAVDKSVKDQPMTTLALAAVVGFVLGALWKS
jgi:ElaB/YqjD/DUF883 family membrane-anchored ribosome-binding protein